MDWADIVLLILPQWFMALLAACVFVLSVGVWRCRKVYAISSAFFVAIGLATLGIGVFYLGAILGYEDIAHGQAASRLASAWQFIIIGAVMFSIRCIGKDE